MKKVSLILLVMIFNICLLAQSQPICAGSDGFNFGSPLPVAGGQLINCGSMSGDADKYGSLVHYIPDNNTAQKTLHINFVILQDENGGSNWQNIPEHIIRLENIIKMASEHYYEIQDLPSDPVSGVAEITDKKIKLQLENIYFLKDEPNTIFNNRSTTDPRENTGDRGKTEVLDFWQRYPNTVNELNIFVKSRFSGGFWGFFGEIENPYPGRTSNQILPVIFTQDNNRNGGYPCTPTSTVTDNCPVSQAVLRGFNVNDSDWTNHLVHEIGHVLDLYHTYGSSSEACDVNDADYMDDLFPPGNWCAQIRSRCNVCIHASDILPWADPADSIRNNLMCGTFNKWSKGIVRYNYVTPKQAGKMHRKIANKPVGLLTSGYSNVPYEITSNETWDFPLRFHRSITVKAGNTLTIKCEVQMGGQARILVESGAHLIIDGGHVTRGGKHMGDWWSGIYVAGNDAQSQIPAYQGRLTIINQGKISYARDAITNIGVYTDGNWNWGSTGGIIYAKDADFENNRRDVQLLSYQDPNFPNARYKATFEACRFTRDENFGIETMLPSITMWQTAGVEMEGCDFVNTSTDDFQYEGGGLFTIRSSYRVHEWNGEGCNFSGYADAIRSLESYSVAFPITIVGATFTDNIHGVYLLATENAKVAHCSLNVRTNHGYTKPLSQPFQQESYGIYLDYTTLFAVHDNEITSTNISGNDAVGIVVKDNFGASSQLYKNEIDNLVFAIQALGNNRSSLNSDLGLNFICNDLGASTLNNHDIEVDPNGDVAATQGAGDLPNNRFGTVTGSLRHFDNLGPNVKYSYGQSDTRVVPTNYTGLTLKQENSNADYNIKCTPRPKTSIVNNPGTTIGDIQALESSMQQDMALRQQLIDEGNPAHLEALILFADDQQDYQNLYIEMMGMSPYVSEENLTNLVGLTGFPELALRNIMVANPHSSRDGAVWDALVNREPPLSQQTLDDIEAELQTITAKDVLDMQIANQQTESEYLSLQLMHYYAENLQENSSYLQDLKDHLAYRDEAYFRYTLVDLFLTEGNVADASATFDNVEVQCEMGAAELDEYYWLDIYYGALMPLVTNDTRLDQLGAGTLGQLEDIAMNGEGKAVGKAMALLELNGAGTEYYEPILDDNGNYKSKVVKKERPQVAPEVFKLYPNPAKDHVILQWDWLEAGLDEGFEVEIRDIKGGLAKKLNISDPKINTKLIDLEGLNPGVYLISTNQEDRVIYQSKLMVQP